MKFTLPDPDFGGEPPRNFDDDLAWGNDPEGHLFYGMDAEEYEVQSAMSKFDPARNLRRLRKQIGQTQDRFAAKLGISRRNLQDLEAGRSKISSEILLQLHVRYGLDLHSFLAGDLIAERTETRTLQANKAIEALVLVAGDASSADIGKIKPAATHLAAQGPPDKLVTSDDIRKKQLEDLEIQQEYWFSEFYGQDQ